MQLINPIDEAAYDEFATAITYYKIFPYIVKDFLTRKDASEIAKSMNLPVSSIVNSVVTVYLPAGPVTGNAVGYFSTQAKPIYNGSFQTPGTKQLAAQIKAKKLSGESGVEGLTSSTEAAMGK